MDDLLTEFLTETAESLEVIDSELVKFESDPNDRGILDNIFRLVHTIKGTCGFLGLPRLEGVAHAGETLLGRFRDGKLDVTPEAVTLVLESIDRIKDLLGHLEAEQAEPAGEDKELISRLEAAAEGRLPSGEQAAPAKEAPAAKAPEPEAPATEAEAEASAEEATESAAGYDADLGRELRPGEVSLADLEAAFQNTAAEDANMSDSDTPAAEEAEAAPAPVAAETPADASGVEGGAARESSIANQTIRVNVEVLENLMTMVSELVLTRNQLMQMVRNTEDSEFKVPLQRLSNITAELQEGVMQTRMQPIGNAWKKLPRIVRDCSRDVGKKINLVMEGQETELDRQVLELIKDPLTHMVRNSCDHGIEKPEDRSMTSKPEVGTLKLRAFHEGGHIIIEIADDGAGLNTEKIRRKAIEKNLVSEAEASHMTDSQIHRFIFHAGFSTAAKVTNLSGRGVGMDVVRTNIEQIGGAIDLNSVEGVGTTFTIKIPLTLAIISALIVAAGEQRFAIPQLSVLELVRVGATSDSTVEKINDTRVMRLRDRLLPLVDLADILKLDAKPSEKGSAFVVVMQVGGQRFGVVVDEVFDTEEIVVKPLASRLRDMSTFSGNTILGDGSVIMIVDPNGISQSIGRNQDEVERHNENAERQQKTYEDEKTSMLLFRAGTPEPKAAPLSLITRLEEIDVSDIERANGQLLVQYRGTLMPLIHAAGDHQIRSDGKQPVLVFTDRDRSAGVAVDEILDIVEERVVIEIASEIPGQVGAAVLKGRATDVMDVGYYLTQACADWFDGKDSERVKEAKRSILLVDDNAFFRNMMAPLLAAAGYEVSTVSGVEEAWALRDTGADFDVIITDIEMPGTDGYEFAERLRNDDRWSEIPRLALSGGREADNRRGDPSDFADFVPKSDRASLIAALDYAMKKAGAAA